MTGNVLKGSALLGLKQALWPHVTLYDKQVEIAESVEWDDETVVAAGNKLGKDFIAAFVVVAFFLTRWPCRIVTTSAKDDHLRVLWGEIGNLVQNSRIPLDRKRGGPLTVNHRELKRVDRDGRDDKISYVVGQVAGPDTMAAMMGHHVAVTGDGVPRTLWVCDESSDADDGYYAMVDTWANRKLIFGNPWPCDNFFRYAVEGRPGSDDPGGDIVKDTRGNREWQRSGRRAIVPGADRPGGTNSSTSAGHVAASDPSTSRPPDGYTRKVFQLGAEDSPNVRYARWEMAQGREPSNRIVVPGVKPWAEYLENTTGPKRWDPVRQCVSLHGRWYKGAENLLFPPEALNRCEQYAEEIRDTKRTGRRGMGVDPAEGGDDCPWACVDESGLIALVSMKTPDTNVIPDYTLGRMRQWGVEDSCTAFDRGGGGKQHVDRLRARGYYVRSVGFGEAVTPDPGDGGRTPDGRTDDREARYAYANRRAEMYGKLALKVATGKWALPREFAELRRQLAVMPRLYDGEGRLRLPPKNRPRGSKAGQGEKTITELLGRSPDEADAVVLANWALENYRPQPVAGGWG